MSIIKKDLINKIQKFIRNFVLGYIKFNEKKLIPKLRKYLKNDHISILVVEDENNWLKVYNYSLDKEVYKITPANDYRTAKFLLAKDEFDLAIIDLHLDEENNDRLGFDLLRIIQNDHPYLPRLVITGADTTDISARLRDLDVDELLPKSKLGRDRIIEAINKAIDKRKIKKMRK